jgi:hypothetical protein
MKVRFIKYAILPFGFLGGLFIAVILWDHIQIPFQNPFNVIGYCAQIKFNPLNDDIRFLVFITLPALFILLTWVMGLKKSFSGEKNEVFVEEERLEPSENLRVGGRETIFLVLYAGLIALNIPTHHAAGKFDPYHEGETLGSSVSSLSGEEPYKDFLFYHGLIQDPLRSVFAFRLFGRSIGAVRTLESIVKIAAWVLLALFLLQLFKKDGVWVFGVITFLAMCHVAFFFNVFCVTFLPIINPETILRCFLDHFSFFQSFDLYILNANEVMSFAFALTLALLFGYLANKEGPSRVGFGLCCFFFGWLPFFSLAYSVDRGVYLFITWLFLLPPVFISWIKGNRFQSSFLLFTFLGCLSGLGLFLWLIHGQIGSFIDFVFIKLPAYKELSEKVPYPIHERNFFLMVVLLALNLAFWFWRYIRLSNVKNEGFLKFWWFKKMGFQTTLLILSVLYFRNALVRSDWEHVIYSVGFLYILSAFVLRNPIQSFFASRKFYRTVFVSSVSFVCVLTFIACCARLGRGDEWKKNFPLMVPDSDFIPNDYKATIDIMRANLKPDEEFFTLTSEASWYYFLEKPCPTRFPYIWIAAPVVYQDQVVGDLERKRVKYVLYRSLDWSYNIDGISNDLKFPVISSYIRKHYIPGWKIDGNEIWIRKNENGRINGSLPILNTQ